MVETHEYERRQRGTADEPSPPVSLSERGQGARLEHRVHCCLVEDGYVKVNEARLPELTHTGWRPILP